MKKDFVFISESVTEGHPDKLCDQIADAIVDGLLQQDPRARVVAECAAARGIVFIAARHTALAAVDIPALARRVINQVGYDRGDFNAENCTVMTSLTELPPREYAPFDEHALDDGAMDYLTAQNNATLFGYACDHTRAYLPLPLWLAHKLARRLAAVRLQGLLPYLAPDGQAQVGVEFRDGQPRRIHSIVLLAAQWGEAHPADKMREDLDELVIRSSFRDEPITPDARTTVEINPGRPFLIGGPSRHSGMTGRKTGIDTYGEYSRHSGAALSGKDPLRIDRVGAYAARYAAKNVVAAGLARECEVQLSYSIGQARPVSIEVETFGTGTITDEAIKALVREHFDFRLAAILRAFNLRHLPALFKGGCYRRLAAYGHMGRMDLGLPWEKVDRAAALSRGNVHPA